MGGPVGHERFILIKENIKAGKSISCNEVWGMNGNITNFEQTPMARPFSIKIFCPDGNPAGLRIISKSNWTGCGLVCPRSTLPMVKGRKEFTQPGVYVLVGPPEEGELPKIYVGEGDAVGPRLEQHYASKEFWTWVATKKTTSSI